MRGFKLDIEAHDLALDGAGRLLFVDDDAATVQEIKTRLLFFKGESFNDARAGVPYFQEILKKGTAPGRVKALLRKAIMSHPQVIDVSSLTLDVDRITRVASVAFVARTLTGRILRSEEFGPLVLS